MTTGIDYIRINREEAQRVAMLFAALSINNNLQIFLSHIGCNQKINRDESGIYVEYAKLRDVWNQRLDSDNSRIGFIVQTSKLSWIREFWEKAGTESSERNLMSRQEIFNKKFISRRGASKNVIESPSNWNVDALNKTLISDEQFLKACRYKWAFNIKPDIVIHTSSKSVICIEAKYCSKEGFYPSSPKDKHVFKDRWGKEFNKKRLSQTQVQKYMIEEALNFDFIGVYIAADDTKAPDHYIGKTWQEVFSWFNLSTINEDQLRLYDIVKS